MLEVELARTGPPIHGRDPFLLDRSFDPHLLPIHVQHVGFDAPLDHRPRKIDPVGGEVLHERLGDDAAAHVAGGGFRPDEVLGIVQVELELEPDGRRELECVVREQRPGRSASHHGDARTVAQLQRIVPGAVRRLLEPALGRLGTS